VKVREVVRLLETNGWQLKATEGSHRQFRHPTKGMVVTVPGQLGKDLLGESMTYTVIDEKGPESWGAYVPDLPGVITVGESREEVEQLIQEAIEFHLEGLRDEGLPIPAPASFAGVVEIHIAA
jgi:predicted RNase H-like HicB family nuclease/predicted RNA binding protein YcfA (HicA-like mRNA interferase family)